MLFLSKEPVETSSPHGGDISAGGDGASLPHVNLSTAVPSPSLAGQGSRAADTVGHMSP